MMQLLIITLLALAPVPVMLILYLRYFQVGPRFSIRLRHFALGGVIACLLLLTAPYFLPYVKGTSFLTIAFFEAALLEKIGTFSFLTFYIYIKKKDISVLNSITTGMLLGVGFATVENIFYSFSSVNSVIFIRLISSVPLHVFTCGIMGYFLGQSRLYGSRIKKIRYFLLAFIVPVVFHGMYDYFFIRGGTLPYLNAALLIFLSFYIEYILARGQIFPSSETLEVSGLFFEEWESVQRDPQYERWILQSMGSKNIVREKFFSLRFEPFKVISITILLASASAAFLNQNDIMRFLSFSISPQESVMLFVLLPALYSLVLLTVNIINPRYFQDSIIKIPIITDLIYYSDGEREDQITYDITAFSCFLKTIEPIEMGSKIRIVLNCSGMQSPEIEAQVIWNYHNLETNQNGTLVRFIGTPFRFYFFYSRYYIYKLLKGIYFNLKLPGAGHIRELFVRPESILQEEYYYEKGTVLFRQGEKGREMFLIRKGEVDIIKKSPAGEEIKLVSLKSGDIFGEMAIAGNQPRLAEARCKTDCIMAKGKGDNLDVLIEQNPEFTHRLIQNFAQRLFSSEEKMLGALKEIEESSKDKLNITITVLRKTLYDLMQVWDEDRSEECQTYRKRETLDNLNAMLESEVETDSEILFKSLDDLVKTKPPD